MHNGHTVLSAMSIGGIAAIMANKTAAAKTPYSVWLGMKEEMSAAVSAAQSAMDADDCADYSAAYAAKKAAHAALMAWCAANPKPESNSTWKQVESRATSADSRLLAAIFG